MSPQSYLKKLCSGSFFRDVAKLTLGTLGGRLITIAALPLLTRLYGPEDFAMLATYIAVVSTIAVGACFRLEIAIPVANNDVDAKNLVVLALIALVLVTLISLAIVCFLPNKIAVWPKHANLTSYMWLIPIGIAALGFFSITQLWATRARRFAQIGSAQVKQALIGVATSISMGWIGVAPLGLLLGNLLNISAGGLTLARWSVKNETEQFKGISISGLKSTLLKYKRYPIYSTPESFFNTAGLQLPILLIAAYAGSEAGFLMLAMQIMVAPMGLLGGAISQVYISRAPQEYQAGHLANFTQTIMLRLFKIGLGPFILLGVFSPWLVPHVFGAGWNRTGEILIWLMPWMLLQFVVSPVSMALHIAGQQVKAMLLQAFGLVSRTGAIFFAVYVMPKYVVEIFAVSSILFYLIYGLIIRGVIRHH